MMISTLNTNTNSNTTIITNTNNIDNRFFLQSEDDLPFEEDILRNPYSIKHWLRYIEHKKDTSVEMTNMIYERALKELPGSYKLWFGYLKMRTLQVRGKVLI